MTDWSQWEDHGDPSVDARWRAAIRRHASLSGAIPPADAYFVPPEFANHGRIPESYFICEDILNAS